MERCKGESSRCLAVANAGEGDGAAAGERGCNRSRACLVPEAVL